MKSIFKMFKVLHPGNQQESTFLTGRIVVRAMKIKAKFGIKVFDMNPDIEDELLKARHPIKNKPGKFLLEFNPSVI